MAASRVRAGSGQVHARGRDLLVELIAPAVDRAQPVLHPETRQAERVVLRGGRVDQDVGLDHLAMDRPLADHLAADAHRRPPVRRSGERCRRRPPCAAASMPLRA